MQFYEFRRILVMTEMSGPCIISIAGVINPKSLPRQIFIRARQFDRVAVQCDCNVVVLQTTEPSL